MIRSFLRGRPLSGMAKCLAVGGLLIAIPLVAAKTQTITVKKGDTLWALAKQYLGSPYKWKDLHAWNKETVKDPNRISPGQQLIIRGEEEEKPTTAAKEPAPTSVEIPVSVVEQMLRDLNARTEAMAKELAAARERLEALEAKAGMLSEHLTQAKETPSVDVDVILKRLEAIEKALGGMVSREDMKAMAKEHTQMAERHQADATAELKMLRAELGALQKAVDSQVEMQSKALTELNVKLAAQKPIEKKEKEEETPKKRGLFGLLSTLAVGIGFLAISASN